MSVEPDLPRGAEATPRQARGGIFYGWWIVFAGTLAVAVNGAVYYYGMAVFFTPLIAEFGWSRTALSGAFSIARMQGGIAGPLTGWAIDRWGPRRMMTVGMVVTAVGFALLARVYSIEEFYFVFLVFLSVGTSLGASAPVGAAVANWFVRRRSLAMGMLMTGGGLGGFLATGLGFLIALYGWRATMEIVAVIVLVTGLPLAAVMRSRPQPYGLRPDGDLAGAPARPTSKIAQIRAARVSFQPRQALATRVFYLMAVMFGLRQLTTNGALLHLPALMVDRGYTLEAAALIAGLVALISVPGRIVCGWLGDRYDQRFVLAGCFALLSITTAVLAAGSSPLHLIIFVVGYGVSYGGSVPLTMSMVADYFGYRWYATIFGLTQFAQMWGSIAGPLLAGYAFDSTGNYEMALNVFTVTNFVGLLLCFIVRPPKPPQRLPAA
ncbi:MAG: MFS transporter [Chloroflexota bacterium]